MEKFKIWLGAHKVLKIFVWVFLILIGVIVAFIIILSIFRIPHYFEKQKTDEQILKIHSAQITIDDVMGKNLPPDPGLEADKTLIGIDANTNGIRDDVELAIYKEYPDSAKTRAALLQYAMALQMEVTQPIINTEIVTEIATEQSRSDSCLSDTLVPRKSPESSRDNLEISKIDYFIKFVENKQFNTESRIDARKSFYKNLRSYGISKNLVCDIDYSTLPN